MGRRKRFGHCGTSRAGLILHHGWGNHVARLMPLRRMPPRGVGGGSGAGDGPGRVRIPDLMDALAASEAR
jgi:hypothetical protein